MACRSLDQTSPISITQLTPLLAAPASRSLRAVITLVWPFSSRTGSVAFLLAEPDFRLRRIRGQVRVQFFGSSAQAVVQRGLASGDDITLGLEGVQFEEEGGVNGTSGRGVNVVLKFTERLVLRFRPEDTDEIILIDIDHPTPEPQPLPVITERIPSLDLLSSVQPTPTSIHATRLSRVSQDGDEWTSPAFRKRTRTSYGSLFDSEYDPFAAAEDPVTEWNRNRKRPKLSYTWRYSSKTPSPEPQGQEDANIAQSTRISLPLMADEGSQTIGLESTGATEAFASPTMVLPENSISSVDDLSKDIQATSEQYISTEPSREAMHSSRISVMEDENKLPDLGQTGGNPSHLDGEAENHQRQLSSHVDILIDHRIPNSNLSNLQQPQQNLHGLAILQPSSLDSDEERRVDQVRAADDVETFIAHHILKPSDKVNPAWHHLVASGPNTAAETEDTAMAATSVQDLDSTHASRHSSHLDREFALQSIAGHDVRITGTDGPISPDAHIEFQRSDEEGYPQMHGALDNQPSKMYAAEEPSSEVSEDLQDFGDMPQHYRYSDHQALQSYATENAEDSDERSHVSYEGDDIESEDDSGVNHEYEDFDEGAESAWGCQYPDIEDEEEEQYEEQEMTLRSPEPQREPEIIDLLSSDDEDGPAAPTGPPHQTDPSLVRDRFQKDDSQSKGDASEASSGSGSENGSEEDPDSPGEGYAMQSDALHDRSKALYTSSGTSSEDVSEDETEAEELEPVFSDAKDVEPVDTAQFPPVLEGLSHALRGFEANATRSSQHPLQYKLDKARSSNSEGKSIGVDDVKNFSKSEEIGDAFILRKAPVTEEMQLVSSQHDAIKWTQPRDDAYNFDGGHDQIASDVLHPRDPAIDSDPLVGVAEELAREEGPSNVSLSALISANDHLPTPNDTQLSQTVVSQTLSDSELTLSKVSHNYHDSAHLTSQPLIVDEIHRDVRRRTEALKPTEDGEKLFVEQLEVQRGNDSMETHVPLADRIISTVTTEAPPGSQSTRTFVPEVDHQKSKAVENQILQGPIEDAAPTEAEGRCNEQLSGIDFSNAKELEASEDEASIDKQLEDQIHSLSHDRSPVSGQVEADALTGAEDLGRLRSQASMSPRRTRHGTRIGTSPVPSEAPEVVTNSVQRKTRGRSKGPLTAVTRDRSPSIIIHSPTTSEGHDASIELAESIIEPPIKYDLRRLPVADLKIRLLRLLRGELSDFTTVKALRYHLGQKLDILAIATTTPAEPQRAKTGPRQYMVSFHITDQTTAPSHVVEVQIYRPFKNALPVLQHGDGILLRNFQVVSMKGKGFGLRSDQNEACSWAVFKSGKEEAEVRGPPVEFGDYEKRYISDLHAWFSALDATALSRLEKANAK